MRGRKTIGKQVNTRKQQPNEDYMVVLSWDCQKGQGELPLARNWEIITYISYTFILPFRPDISLALTTRPRNRLQLVASLEPEVVSTTSLTRESSCLDGGGQRVFRVWLISSRDRPPQCLEIEKSDDERTASRVRTRCRRPTN